MRHITKCFLISFIIIMNILCLFSAGCDRIRHATIFDVGLINESQYPILIIREPSSYKNNEWSFTYTYLNSSEMGNINLNPPQVEKSPNNFHTLRHIYVFSEKLCLENYEIQYAFRQTITDKKLENILTNCNTKGIFSRHELFDIVKESLNQFFYLDCIINDFMEIHCEPTIYPIGTQVIRTY